MLISLAVVPVGRDVWISNLTADDIRVFGKPYTTGMGSHLIGLRDAKLDRVS